uniref:CSON010001 protein n=1 Tax=Culicoides sonorensis TaxID=179676 RepID=A0A336MYB1_CULSO
MDKICRVCLLEKSKLIDIFTLDDTEDTVLALFEKIIQCTNVTIIRNENWPQHICAECKDDLNVAYRFRMNVESSDVILRQFNLGNTVIESDINFTDNNEVIEEFETDNRDCESPVTYENIESIESPLPAKSKTSEVQIEKDLIKVQEVTVEKMHVKENLKTKTIMTIPKLSKEEKPPIIKGVTKETSPDGSVKTLLRISRSANTTTKNRKKSEKEQDMNAHVCDECGKGFKKASALRAHSKRHLSIKPNVCEICNKSFVLPVELKRHFRTHSGEKPYDCRYCDKKFSDFGTRVKHERCSHCQKRFIKPHQLKCHLTTHGIGITPKRKSAKQSKEIPSISEADEIITSVSSISNELQTIQVVPTGGDTPQSYMLYLKK